MRSWHRGSTTPSPSCAEGNRSRPRTTPPRATAARLEAARCDGHGIGITIIADGGHPRETPSPAPRGSSPRRPRPRPADGRGRPGVHQAKPSPGCPGGKQGCTSGGSARLAHTRGATALRRHPPSHTTTALDAYHRSRNSRAVCTNCRWNWKMPAVNGVGVDHQLAVRHPPRQVGRVLRRNHPVALTVRDEHGRVDVGLAGGLPPVRARHVSSGVRSEVTKRTNVPPTRFATVANGIRCMRSQAESTATSPDPPVSAMTRPGAMAASMK